MEYQELNLKDGAILTAANMAHIEQGISAVTSEVAQMKTAKIVLRNDGTQNWATANPVLLKGEPAIEFDENNIAKVKIGDGKTAWNDLPYLVTETINEDDDNQEGGTEIPADLEERLITLEETIGGFDVRIQNTESGVAAAVTTSEEAFAAVEALRTEIAANTEAQNASIAAIEAKVNENVTLVETINTEFEEVKNIQNTQQSQIDATNARMDVLVTSATPDANSELLDIRAGYDGIVYDSAGAAVREIGYNLNKLSQNIGDALGKEIVDGLAYEGNQLYLTANGEKVGDSVTITGGSGGGGINQTYAITLLNLLDSRAITITDEEECVIKFSYHSIDEDGYNDGPGIGYIYVNNSQAATISVTQGENIFNITSHLAKGENNIKIQVENSEGARKTLTYTVNVLVLSISTTAPEMGLYSGQVSLPYTVTGAGEKLVHILLDGREILQDKVVSSGTVSRVIVIPESIEGVKLEGAHVLSLYAEVQNGLIETIKSNVLQLGMLYYSYNQAILMLDYKGPKEVEQGATLTFPYLVYDPFLQTTEISLNIYNEDGTLYSTFPLQVDQTPKEWTTQDYPAGKVTFEIKSKDAVASQTINIAATTFNKEVITDGRVLDFNARGRSNNEANPAQWNYEDITAEFEGFGWTDIDGWVTTDEGQTALRFLPGNTMKINYKPFIGGANNDIRNTGYTIEAEFATHNVRDYDSVIISSVDDGRGLTIKSQSAELTSESSAINVLFKEDSRVRVTFIIEPRSLYRFIYVFVNGVMSGVFQYLDGDNFAQAAPAEITIGAESCGLDLYNLRLYNRILTRHEQLNNFICDRASLGERIEANNRNDVLDDNDMVSVSRLPMKIPYLIIESEMLPPKKGEKVNGALTYVEPLRPERSFTANGVQLDVQGTSSQGYPVKNYKLKLKKGLKYTQSGNTADGFPIIAGGLECKAICIKADYASSEQANNVCLVDYYEMLSPYKTPAQEENPLVRTAIRGFPCVVFWKNTTDNTTTFLGTYNFNDDKSNENVFGFDREKYPNCECVEFKNNTSDRVLFDRSEYEEWGVDDKNNPIEAWRLDFEYRFPDLDDPYKDYTQFKRMTDWVVSTNRNLATNEALEKSINLPHWKTGNSTLFDIDNADYRLSKFKAEFEDYFIKDAMIFYYLFTEIFLLMDNRAKNLFLTTFDGSHWFPIPYDMDSALGINNEGELDFEYDLEDTDQVHGKDVFTGQQSALWHNVRDCFPNERGEMYRSLRTSKKLAYEVLRDKMANHQSVWPEAIWNEDKYNKYINPYLGDAEEKYFGMLLGDKKSQRDWWLFNGFKYRDSKYSAGDAMTKFITLRTYAAGDITVTPYSHICPRIQYGSVYAGGERVKRNTPVTLPCVANNLNDTETYIYSADRIASIGDLSPLQVGLVNISAATKLQEIVVGNESPDYKNSSLESLTVGNNELLRLVNVSNCDNDKFINLDLSGCHGLEEVLAEGTKLTGIALPNGGHLKTLKFPATIANLTIQNQKNIETLSLQSQENLTTLRIEGTPGLPIETLINNSPKLNRVRLTNVEWNATNEETLRITLEKLTAAKGLDANGINLDKAVVTGRVYITTITEKFLEDINDNFPELVVVVDGIPQYFIRYVNYDNEPLYRYIASEGTAAIDPLLTGDLQETPIRPNTDYAHYSYREWSELPTAIYRPYSIKAEYDAEYQVLFYNGEGEIGSEQWIKEFESAADPIENGTMSVPKKESDAQNNYIFIGWDNDYTSITENNRVFYPVFKEELRSYPVYFYNGDIKLQESQVFYGDEAIFTGDITQIFKMVGGEPSPYYTCTGWYPVPGIITGPTRYEAQFTFNGYIEDEWETIIENCRTGNIGDYGLGGRKKLTFTLAGVEATVEMEIVGKNHDNLAEVDANYNNGASTAALTFIARVLRPEIWNMNSTLPDWNTEGEIYPFPPETDKVAGYNWGGWGECKMRKRLDQELFGQLPVVLQNNIKPVIKLSDRGRYFPDILNETIDKIWLPSALELGSEAIGTVAAYGQGKTYPVYNIDSSRIKEFSNGNPAAYWTRSSDRVSSHQYRDVDVSGFMSSNGGSSSMAIAFGFCL